MTIAGFMHGAENLFPNGNFTQITNNRPRGWSGGSDGQLAIVAGGVETNSQTWQIQAAASAQTLEAPGIAGKFTGTYVFRGFYQASVQCNKSAKFTVEFLNSQNEVLLTRTQILPSTTDEWIACFDQYDAPANSAKVAIKIIVEPGTGVIKLTGFSFRAGTLKDYASEFSVEVPKGKERFPVFGWISPGDRPNYKAVRELYNSPRMHAEYAYSNHSVWGDPAFNSLQIVRPNITAEEAKSAASAWVIMAKDEPTPKRFDGLLAEKAKLAEILPGVPYFNNLLPCYAKNIFADHNAYVQYLIDYRDKFKPKYVTVDYYSLHTRPPIYSISLWANLYDMQKVYGNTETNWGMILAVLHFGSNRSPSEAELRWQAYSSLAYGAKIIGWFTFLEPIDSKLKPSADAVIQIDGNRSFHYAMLRKLNREILQLGPSLLKLKSTGTFHSPVLPPKIYSLPVKEGNLVSKVTGGQIVVGEFVHRDNGKFYVLLTNRDFMKDAVFKFSFDAKVKSLREVSRQTGELLPALTLNTGKVFELKLAAGDGLLFQLITTAGE